LPTGDESGHPDGGCGAKTARLIVREPEPANGEMKQLVSRHVVRMMPFFLLTGLKRPVPPARAWPTPVNSG
jgi:hypothetical protein